MQLQPTAKSLQLQGAGRGVAAESRRLHYRNQSELFSTRVVSRIGMFSHHFL